MNRTFKFAAAMPPRAEAMFHTSSWLKAIHHAKYTHVCLQNDPFFHPEMDLRDNGESIWRHLSLFDMTTGPRQRSYLEWLSTISERAGNNGLRLAMEVWEPRLTRYARYSLPQDWQGPELSGGWVKPLCVSNPEAREWLLKGFQTILQSAPLLDTLILGINDNGAHLCGRECPRCRDESPIERLGKLYADIESACLQNRPDFKVFPYAWGWDEAYYQGIISKVKKGSTIVTRMERGAHYTPDPTHPEWSGTVYDVGLACEEIGQEFKDTLRIMQEHEGEIVVMPTLAGMFEGYHLPYVPALGLVANKAELMRQAGVKGWLDFDCGGIHQGVILDLVSVVQNNPSASVEEWLKSLAEQRYGTSLVARALSIWSIFDDAVRKLPTLLHISDVPDFAGRFGMASGLLPWHPFLPERIIGKYAGLNIFHFDPHCFATENALPPVRHCMRRVLSAVDGVLQRFDELFDQAEPGTARKNADLDRAIAELTLLNWQSVFNFFEWAASLRGDASVDRKAVLQNEIETTNRFRQLAARADIDMGNMTWHPERCIAMSVPQATGDIWRAVEVDHIVEWSDPLPCPEQVGNLWGWKIAHLTKQLEQMTESGLEGKTSRA